MAATWVANAIAVLAGPGGKVSDFEVESRHGREVEIMVIIRSDDQ